MLILIYISFYYICSIQPIAALCIDHWVCGGAREDRVERDDTLVGRRLGTLVGRSVV